MIRYMHEVNLIAEVKELTKDTDAREWKKII